MEGGSLFNPGYLGANFKWWIGQVTDDAYWRDNIVPGRIKKKDGESGWGRRYKVRIIGLHDQGETEIPSDQLPWANVMYPITAGGGQTSTVQTPAIRQGNIVFGFFMDSDNDEIPVIMGILGNNVQTPLNTQTPSKDPKVTNNTPGSLATSGFAQSVDPPDSASTPSPPDRDLITDKPKDPENQSESASLNPPPGVGLNDYGLRADKPLSAKQQFDVSQAFQHIRDSSNDTDQWLAESGTGFANWEQLRNSGIPESTKNKIRKQYVSSYVRDQVKDRTGFADSPQAPAQPGATIESGASSPQIQTAADIKKDDKYNKEKIPLLKGDTESATKNIQIAIENLTAKQEKVMSAQQQYADAVSNPEIDLEKETNDTAHEIAKYQKIIYNKMMEYGLKKYNKEQKDSVSALPSSKRWQFADVKEEFTVSTLKEYNEITDGLADETRGSLKDQMDVASAQAQINAILAAGGNRSNNVTYIDPYTGESKTVSRTGDLLASGQADFRYPDVTTCYAEGIVAHSLANNKAKIEANVTNKMIENTKDFMKDISKEMEKSGAGKEAKKLKGITPSIQGNMVAAMQFKNTKTNTYDFEPARDEAVSDYYTFGKGGEAQPETSQPSLESIQKQAKHYEGESLPSSTKVPFLEPSKNQADLVFREHFKNQVTTDLTAADLAGRTFKQLKKDGEFKTDNLGDMTYEFNK
tara:strand:- start:475 stop:2559 length:2085 start_codon:yes stop_codon:yes gene_type:complete